MKNTKLYHFKVVNDALVWYNMVVVLGLLRRKEQRRLSERNRNQKRRDKKGRILRNGESQRADGRYAFVYTDCFGKQKFLYSWKLESTDPLPVGRRPCQSLREKEKVILRDINDGITPYGDNLTVLELVKKYIAQKTGVRHNTAANYQMQKHGWLSFRQMVGDTAPFIQFVEW